MRQESLCIKQIVVITLLALWVAPGLARNPYRRSEVTHYITLNLGGGEANTLSTMRSFPQTEFKDKIGAHAQGGLGYELRKNHFTFGFGFESLYDYVGQGTDKMLNSFDRIDKEADSIIYEYRYSDYVDYQQVLSVGVPIYFGASIKHFFINVGARIDMGMLGMHKTTTMLQTVGTYKRFVQTIENVPEYGYYRKDEYTYQNQYFIPTLSVTPTLELGGRWEVAKRVEMGFGVYAEYSLPVIGEKKNLPLVDYSYVDENPQTMNHPNLRATLVFNAIPNSNMAIQLPGTLRLGVRWNIYFQVQHTPHICICEKDL